MGETPRYTPIITLAQGKSLGPGDLALLVRDANGALVDPVLINFSIFTVDPNSSVQTLIYGPQAAPARASLGAYYVPITIPTGWNGQFQLQWQLKQYADGAVATVVEDFTVQAVNPASGSYEAPSVAIQQAEIVRNKKWTYCVMQVRELLSDENPDRNYHFRPPTPGKIVANYTTRVGFIWTDQTIIRMFNTAISALNWFNKKNIYNFNIDTIPVDWANVAALKAAALCLSKEAARWTADEFNFSLNGISLDLSKADKYRGLAAELNTQFDELADKVTANRPASVGLRQQRWLLG